MENINTNISHKKVSSKIFHRNTVEILRKRVELLRGKDRLLMKIYLEKGINFRQMAQLTGLSEGIITRRIRKLTDRLVDSRYITCMRYQEKFSVYQLDIARDYFLHGLSIRKIALKRRHSKYRISTIVRRIKNLIKVLESSEFNKKSA